MDGIDGMLIAERVCKTDEACLLVFVTSSRQHAMESFCVRAFDYLLKPYTYEQFLDTCAFAIKNWSALPIISK